MSDTPLVHRLRSHPPKNWRERLKQFALAHLLGSPNSRGFLVGLSDQLFRPRKTQVVADLLGQLAKKWHRPNLSILPIAWIKHAIRFAFRDIILMDNSDSVHDHVLTCHKNGMQVNVNFLGEAVLGDAGAMAMMQQYDALIRTSTVDMVSIKLSSIASQIHPLDHDRLVVVLVGRIGQLARVAMAHNKPLMIDMEAFSEWYLTLDVVSRLLEDVALNELVLGVALQAYLPEAMDAAVQVAEYANHRQRRGGKPVRIRVVKGANLAMERVVAADKGWGQAPFDTKTEVDAQYLRVISAIATTANPDAVIIGIGSHNGFTITQALDIAKTATVTVELLEGMATSIADELRQHDRQLPILMYAPLAADHQYYTTMAYLIRRVDENLSLDHFLPILCVPDYAPLLASAQAAHEDAIALAAQPLGRPDRQDRRVEAIAYPAEFNNVADTDWRLPHHKDWAASVTSRVRGLELPPMTPQSVSKIDAQLEVALLAQDKWASRPWSEKKAIMMRLYECVAAKRQDLIAWLVKEAKKPIEQADSEVSEAIDFIGYYTQQRDELEASGHHCEPRGLTLVCSPWNFPASIALGGLIGALVMDNVVLLKPAPEARHVGAWLVACCHEAGIPTDVCQLVICDDEPVGAQLVTDDRLAQVILTGATQTARRFLAARPDLTLIAETGGKNTLIVMDSADKDQAVAAIVASAFGYAGQKCSALDLLICEKAVYDDPAFRNALADATKSLVVGDAWDVSTTVPPVIRELSAEQDALYSQLEDGQTWLVAPQRASHDPCLLHPAIKLGVLPEHDFFHTEAFAPILGVVCADDLDHAIALANSTQYGLTAGLMSLNEQDKATWKAKMVVGNQYINRSITGAIVKRQPFGGCKASSFGMGFKAGGPQYLFGLGQVSHPKPESIGVAATRLKTEQSMSNLYGQSNTLRHEPLGLVMVRSQSLLDESTRTFFDQLARQTGTKISIHDAQTDASFISEVGLRRPDRVRFLSQPRHEVLVAMASMGVGTWVAPRQSVTTLECGALMREVATSETTHRYGIV